MRPAAHLALLLSVLPLAAPVVMPLGPTPAQLERNRRLLARWRKDPAHYARLKQDLRAFQALPPERQAALRQLDEELSQEAPAARGRLWHVMDRYAAWRDHLAEADRRRIDTAPTTADRLRVIRDIREREWIDRLPRARRGQLARAPDAKRRADLLAGFRKEEAERRQEWQHAGPAEEAPPWRMPPLRVTDLPTEVQLYVWRDLLPLLAPEERQKLRRSEGPGPPFGRTLLELVDRHPPALPGPPTGPTRPRDLPREARERLLQVPPAQRKRLNPYLGRWPDYAIEVTRLLRSREAGMPQELGPCRPEAFPPPVQQFLTDKLLPRLTAKEKQRLAAAEGRWPDYPGEVLQLARQHNLQVPGLVLPGPPRYWERLRAAVGDDKVTR